MRISIFIAVGSLFVFGLQSLNGRVEAETKTLPKGPPAEVTKQADKHLFQIWITPPKKSNDYAPGEISIMLRCEYPDYLYVPLMYTKLKDGKLHVQIAISEESESKYSIVVLDRQKDNTTLDLFWKALPSIATEKP
ncbi:MAG: hypothetical protein WED34_07565 [Planctomycetales bacterium]